MSDARLVVTNVANRAKLDEIAGCPPVATVREPGDALPERDIDFRAALDARPDTFRTGAAQGHGPVHDECRRPHDGPAEGRAGAAARAARVRRVHARRGRPARRRPVLGISPIRAGRTGSITRSRARCCSATATTLYEGGFTVDSTYDVIERLGITSLAGSPTAYRMLMAAGTEAAARAKGKLRVVSSAGEPLNPEVVRWFDAALDAPIYDHYGQTELGMVVNNHHGLAHVVHAGFGRLRDARLSRRGARRSEPRARPRRARQSRDRHRALAAAVVPRLLAARTRRRSRAATTGPATTSNWSRTAP
ncbi:AMP-binding protein [Burkholderia pyrrocinia]|uniref:AMP-binding protein n=1 Tax=Burkholderia pyrrocinia TaxID=60550 RepID=UPI003083BCE8